MPEVPVEQTGAHGEGLDVEVPVDGSGLDDPSEAVHMYNAEIDAISVAPRYAFDSLHSKRGWVEYDPNDPDSLESAKSAQPLEADSVPPDEETPADPELKDGTSEPGAAPAADKE